MVHSFSSSIYLPFTLFETVACFNDVNADDMKCGDMGEQELLSLGLKDISARVDPYQLIRYDFPYKHHLDGFLNSITPGVKISHEECIDILFNEMKELSQMFSFQGEYKALIGLMIDHFRYGNGSHFYNQRLDSAFHSRVNSYSHRNPFFIIKNNIKNKFINNADSMDFLSFLKEIQRDIYRSELPKFNEKKNRINGLGITVHDIAAQKITLINLQRYAMGWSATVFFEAQDHFGLDIADIKNPLYSQFRFFRIWFFLQRHRDFAFKPFFTNFKTIERMSEY
ncbi:YPO3983 family protein [Enterobacter hormaechei]|uniref:YPO3983 family protein n=1 Tax=Enterobacter hormaechei TaxID=158836 RepID=UPI003F444ECB